MFSCHDETLLSSQNLERYISTDSLLTHIFPFYSESKLDSLREYNSNLMNESIQFPNVYSLEFFLEDIINFSTNKSDYIIKSNIAAYLNKKELIINNDTLVDFNPDDFMSINFEGNLNSGDSFISDFKYDGEYFHETESDSLHQWSKKFESKKYLNWNMSDYPFDVQELKVEIMADNDTTLTRFRESKEFPAKFSDRMSLPQGFEIKSIDFTEKFLIIFEAFHKLLSILKGKDKLSIVNFL